MGHLVAYREGEIKGMVEELRVDGWNFNFYGATTQAKKDELKDQANGLGFRAAETLVFDFDGRQFGALLKSMLKQIVGNDQEENLFQIVKNVQKVELVECAEREGPIKLPLVCASKLRII